MKTILFLILFIPATLYAQQSKVWMQKLENPDFFLWELKKENYIDKYRVYDFSSMLMPKKEFLGYIGDEYQRIYVCFSSVEKDALRADRYILKGYSIVHNNKCDFTGTIEVKQVREFKKLYMGVDSMYKDMGIKAQGALVGTYTFKENPEQKHVGTFQGTMTLWWYLDRNGKIQYSDLWKNSDNMRNNQYIGTWKEYGGPDERVCNLGEYRIPFSGDLDIGAAHFSPNPKYEKQGWEDLIVK